MTEPAIQLFKRIYKATATFTTVSSATSSLTKTRQSDKATPLGRPRLCNPSTPEFCGINMNENRKILCHYF